MTKEQRSAIYAFVAATVPVLVAVGAITESMAPLVLAQVEAFLGVLVAFWHRPTKTEPALAQRVYEDIAVNDLEG